MAHGLSCSVARGIFGTGSRILNHCATREVPGKMYFKNGECNKEDKDEPKNKTKRDSEATGRK